METPRGKVASMTVFTIDGRCPTKGSTRSLLRHGKIVTFADNAKLAGWTKQARKAAHAAGVRVIGKPHGVELNVIVEFVKPRSSKATTPSVRPDMDKLLRAILDMLTGVGYADDSQVVSVTSKKAYGPSERVTVMIGRAA
jgi:Holliday junction resolvase RusA-like endonuclease